MKVFGANLENIKSFIAIQILNKTYFFCCFSIIFAKIPNRSLTQAGPWGGRIPRTVQDLLHTLFRRCKKDLFWAKLHMIKIHERVRKSLRNKCKKSRSGQLRSQRNIYNSTLQTCKIKRSPTIGDFGRHQNACFVHEIIRLPTWIFVFSFFSCFFDEPREKATPRWVGA